jgi:hypothetical protein
MLLSAQCKRGARKCDSSEGVIARKFNTVLMRESISARWDAGWLQVTQDWFGMCCCMAALRCLMASQCCCEPFYTVRTMPTLTTTERPRLKKPAAT